MSNYARDKKLERLYTLDLYNKMVKDPVGPDNKQLLKQKQQVHLQELMRIAYQIPFYRERFERSNTTPADYQVAEDLYKFPILTKDELRDWMDDEIERFPEKYKYWSVAPTSGSTGRPLRTLRSPREHAFTVANWLRVMTLPGYNPFRGKTMSRPNSLHAPGGKVAEYDSPLQRLGILRRKYMSDTIQNRVDTQVLVDEINAYKPDYLYNHANVLARIAQYVKDNNLTIWQPKFYSPVSEMTTPAMEALMKDVFGPGFVNPYGMSETDSRVVKLPGRDYFQVISDDYVVNTYADDLRNPSLNGMAVVTPLMKKDLPLINYCTLDYMETYMEDGLRYVTNIIGRMNDVIYHADGGITEWGNIGVVMNYLPEVVAYRIIQDVPGKIHVLLVRNSDVDASRNDEIVAKMEEGMQRIFRDDTMEITHEWVEDIPSDANGKLRVIVSHVKAPGKEA